uniref:Uncharacterized protein n=1 Tax=Rhizophora mucronata TaxID=61149 RepID=A0A2P2PAU9_RHIMU
MSRYLVHLKNSLKLKIWFSHQHKNLQNRAR